MATHWITHAGNIAALERAVRTERAAITAHTPPDRYTLDAAFVAGLGQPPFTSKAPELSLWGALRQLVPVAVVRAAIPSAARDALPLLDPNITVRLLLDPGSQIPADRLRVLVESIADLADAPYGASAEEFGRRLVALLFAVAIGEAGESLDVELFNPASNSVLFRAPNWTGVPAASRLSVRVPLSGAYFGVPADETWLAQLVVTTGAWASGAARRTARPGLVFAPLTPPQHWHRLAAYMRASVDPSSDNVRAAQYAALAATTGTKFCAVSLQNDDDRRAIGHIEAVSKLRVDTGAEGIAVSSAGDGLFELVARALVPEGAPDAERVAVERGAAWRALAAAATLPEDAMAGVALEPSAISYVEGLGASPASFMDGRARLGHAALLGIWTANTDVNINFVVGTPEAAVVRGGAAAGGAVAPAVAVALLAPRPGRPAWVALPLRKLPQHGAVDPTRYAASVDRGDLPLGKFERGFESPDFIDPAHPGTVRFADAFVWAKHAGRKGLSPGVLDAIRTFAASRSGGPLPDTEPSGPDDYFKCWCARGSRGAPCDDARGRPDWPVVSAGAPPPAAPWREYGDAFSDAASAPGRLEGHAHIDGGAAPTGELQRLQQGGWLGSGMAKPTGTDFGVPATIGGPAVAQAMLDASADFTAVVPPYRSLQDVRLQQAEGAVASERRAAELAEQGAAAAASALREAVYAYDAPPYASVRPAAQTAIAAPGEEPMPAPLQTAVPVPLQTAVPAQGQTAMPAPLQTAVSAQGQTAMPAPPQTAVPAQGQTAFRPPGQTAVPAQGQTAVPAPPQTAVPAQGQTAFSMLRSAVPASVVEAQPFLAAATAVAQQHAQSVAPTAQTLRRAEEALAPPPDATARQFVEAQSFAPPTIVSAAKPQTPVALAQPTAFGAPLPSPVAPQYPTGPQRVATPVGLPRSQEIGQKTAEDVQSVPKSGQTPRKTEETVRSVAEGIPTTVGAGPEAEALGRSGLGDPLRAKQARMQSARDALAREVDDALL